MAAAYNTGKANGLDGWALIGVTIGGGILGGLIGALGGYFLEPFILGGGFGGGLLLASGGIQSSAATIVASYGVVVVGGITIVTAAAGVGAITALGLNIAFEEEHTTNTRPSNREKHENGQAARQRSKGGEKGDKRRINYRKNKRKIINTKNIYINM